MLSASPEEIRLCSAEGDRHLSNCNAKFLGLDITTDLTGDTITILSRENVDDIIERFGKPGIRQFLNNMVDLQVMIRVKNHLAVNSAEIMEGFDQK